MRRPVPKDVKPNRAQRRRYMAKFRNVVPSSLELTPYNIGSFKFLKCANPKVRCSHKLVVHTLGPCAVADCDCGGFFIRDARGTLRWDPPGGIRAALAAQQAAEAKAVEVPSEDKREAIRREMLKDV